MVESQILPAAAGGHTASCTSCTTMGYLALHPVGTAVVGAILIGVGAYYLGKHFANRASKKEEVAAPAAAAAAA